MHAKFEKMWLLYQLVPVISISADLSLLNYENDVKHAKVNCVQVQNNSLPDIILTAIRL